MKATVLVRLKTEVLDPQGEAVRRALTTMGIEGVRGVRIGNLVEIELDEVGDAAATAGDIKARLEKIADELLANPVIEDYEVVVGE